MKAAAAMVRKTLCFSRPFNRLRKFIKKAIHPGGSFDGGIKEQKYFPVGQEEYEMMEEIGRGGSAIVYKAKCLALNEVVAVKCLDLDGTGADMEKIQREAKTLLLLSHPSVLSAHCFFLVNQYLWEVMPFMAGAMLPETRNGKRNEKRERYEKRCLEVSHIRNEEREKNIINHKHQCFTL